MEKRLVHDYPRLAKESGFNFCFRFKKVNWNKLDELDVEEIAFRGKYDQLEQSIDLILNCDLDEDVTKVLDKNFVKLFRLAQISVGYLRHCLLYLDQCVVLLQEKLSNAPKETSGLNILEKDDKDKFECEKCQKVFLTSSYLTAHQKRRHPASPEKALVKSASTQTEPIKSFTISTEQQTDSKRSFAAITQTILPRMFDKGVMTDVVDENSNQENYENKLDVLLKRLEAVEAKSEKPKDVSGVNNENTLILQYLENLMPLLTAPKAEKISLPNELKNQKEIEEVVKKDEALLIDLDEPLSQTEKINFENVREKTATVEKPIEKPRARRIKIASPLEMSEEEESIQQPLPKPRISNAQPSQKREAFVSEKLKETTPQKIVKDQFVQNSARLITFSPEKDTMQIPIKMSLEGKIDRKMRELGLDPEWTRLPDESFRNVMSILQHQIRNPALANLRRELELKVESMVRGKKEILPAPVEPKPIMYDTDTDQESDSESIETKVQETPKKPAHESREVTETIRQPIQKSTTISQEPEINFTYGTIRQIGKNKEDPVKESAETKTTDFSIFQVKSNEKPEKKESDSDESEPIKIKSSLLIKNKEEPKKRVVFADNFVLETTHDQLLDIDNHSSSSSNSWDTPTP